MVDYKGFIEDDAVKVPTVPLNDPDPKVVADGTMANTPLEGVLPEHVGAIVTEHVERVLQSKQLEGPPVAKKRMLPWVAVIVTAAMLTGTMAGVGYQVAGQFSGQDSVDGAYYLDAGAVKAATMNYGMTESIPDMADRLGPAVVSINSTVSQTDFFLNPVESQGAGTGVVFNISKDALLIVTNNHVIENASLLTVVFDDTTTAKAQVIGTDPDADVAVIKVLRSELSPQLLTTIEPIVFGDSDKIRVGELAVAIGNPLGYNDTVTVGVISGIDRSLRMSGHNFNLIQTDAAINPGNSGGALVNAKGEMIGINTIKIAEQDVEGIGFAIPINTVKPLIKEILEKGYVSKPYLGIAGRDITQDIADMYKLPTGVLVNEVVTGSAAEKAGLKRGDIITALDGKPLTSMEVLIDHISSKKVGDTITLTVKRENTELMTLKAVLGDKNKK